MKQLFLLALVFGSLPVYSSALLPVEKDTSVRHPPVYTLMVSGGYFHQRTNGAEAGVIFSRYSSGSMLKDLGLFAGTDLCFNYGDIVLAPKTGLRTIIRWNSKFSGNLTANVFTGLYATAPQPVFFLAPELGLNVFNFCELYYQHQFTSRDQLYFTHNRIGIRLPLRYIEKTLGENRSKREADLHSYPFTSAADATGNVLTKDRSNRRRQDVLSSYSVGYHYQGFSGIEAGVHFTQLGLLIGWHEVGIFLGSDVQFSNGSTVLAPKLGLESVFTFEALKGVGFANRLYAGGYGTPQGNAFFLAPEIAVTWLTVFDIFYQYQFTDRTPANWTPHRFGIRLTLGTLRSPVAVMYAYDWSL